MGGLRTCVAVICLTSILSHLTAVAGEESCAQSAKMDLQIIVDSSGSVGEGRFHIMMKQISQSLIGQLNIGADQTRVALYKYSDDKAMRNEFSLSTFTSLSELQAQVEATTFESGYTWTAMAMNKALEHYKQEQRAGGDVARVCLLFTDGVATDKEEVPAASKAWADDEVAVYAIGIGSGIDQQGLIDIAGTEERVLRAKDFDAIAALAKNLMHQVCAAAITAITRVGSVCTSWKSNEEMTLDCPTGFNIEVLKAFYGYWASDSEKCHYQAADCTTTTDNPACSGSSCLVKARRSVLSLSCGRIHDYMQVEYKCVEE